MKYRHAPFCTVAAAVIGFGGGMAANAASPAYIITDLMGAGDQLFGAQTHIIPRSYRGSWAYGINDNGQVVGGASFSVDDNGNMVDRAFVYSGGEVQFLEPLPGDDSSLAMGINNSGQVVGYSYIYRDGYPQRAFVYGGGVMTDLNGILGSAESIAADINDAGQIVGYAVGYSDGWAFLYSGGDMTDIGPTAVIGNGINDNGDVAGWGVTEAGDSSFPFLYSGGVMTDLCAGGCLSGVAQDINASRQVVGNFSPGANIEHAFLYSDGMITDISTASGDARAFAINNSGQVVGESDGHAFLYSSEGMVDLNSLLPTGSNWELRTAYDINNRGQIVGIGWIGGYEGGLHAFLMSPVPAPAAVWLFGSGLLGLVGVARRKAGSK